MKKYLFFLLFLGSLTCKGQWFLNYSRTELFVKFASRLTYKKAETFDIYSWNDSIYNCQFVTGYLHQEKYPKYTLLFFKDQIAITNFVNLLNTTLVSISPSEWREYYEGKIVSVKFDTSHSNDLTSFIVEYIE